MTKPHTTKSIKVWADVDIGIADFVIALNEIPGIRTLASCQGTIGEGGAAPYEAQVMVTWEDATALQRIAHLRITPLGQNFGYVHPQATHDLDCAIAAEREACLAIVAAVHNNLESARAHAWEDNDEKKALALREQVAVASLIGANINARSSTPRPLSSFVNIPATPTK